MKPQGNAVLDSCSGEKRSRSSARLPLRPRLDPKWGIPLVYLAVALPTVLILCFLLPPMQSPDEGRHFLRACQIAEGQLLSQIDPQTAQAGGVLPSVESEFVRKKMSTDFLRTEDRLHTIRERLAALDHLSRNQPPSSERRFVGFPGAAVYPPLLYAPQAAAIAVASLLSNKVYVAFYAARIANALAAIALVSFALYLAPTHRYILIIPAALPMSLSLFASVSTDAALIALGILFVALSTRFIHAENVWLRVGIVATLLLLTLGKPVYLPAALLLLAAHPRLAWRKAIVFCSQASAICAAAYLGWAQMAKEFFAKAASDFPNRNPLMQVHFITSHPVNAIEIFLTTLWDQAALILLEAIGRIGWPGLLLPTRFYLLSLAIGATILACVALNGPFLRSMRWLWAGLAAALATLAVLVAAYVLWTAPGSPHVVGVQGRYLIPVFTLLAFAAPGLSNFTRSKRIFLYGLSLGFFALSAFWTVRVVDHYYFPRSVLLGRNIHTLYKSGSSVSCPASISFTKHSWFSVTETGQVTAQLATYHVILAEPDGTIIAESDPALLGSGHATWRANAWMPNKPERVDSWLTLGKSACVFGHVYLVPQRIPNA